MIIFIEPPRAVNQVTRGGKWFTKQGAEVIREGGTMSIKVAIDVFLSHHSQEKNRAPRLLGHFFYASKIISSENRSKEFDAPFGFCLG